VNGISPAVDRYRFQAKALAYASERGFPTWPGLNAMPACSATGATRRCVFRASLNSKGMETILCKEDNRLIVEPVRKGRLHALL
jgi:hypothetical protein